MKKNIRFLSLVLISFVIFQTSNLFGWSLQQGKLMTRWAAEVDPDNTLPEYPRPQMVRSAWMNLNGIWEYQPGAESDSVPAGQTLTDDILVPFPVESPISGVMEHHDRLWYRRTFEIPAGWDGQRVLIHFGAVDWESEVYVNGTSVGIHQGGYDPFTFDITSYLNGTGAQELIVRVYDQTDDAGYPRGKQTLYPGGIMYTPCTGIWQTVWLEPVPQISISEIKLVPDVDHKSLKVTGLVSESAPNLTIQAIAYDNGVEVGSINGAAGDELSLNLRQPKLWSPDNPFLYDLKVILKQGQTVLDQVDSYFGMRKVSLGTDNGVVKVLLNDEFIFQMGPLDQGFWPDGVYTAPTDEALKWDLEMTKAFGFNMTRKHIKVEPARWYYWADKLGLMVWQDMPSMNSYIGGGRPVPPLEKEQYKTEMTRMIKTHWNSPSIVMWVIFNEFQGIHDTSSLYQMVKDLDPSRVANINSGDNGGAQAYSDVYDIHSYPPPNYPIHSTNARACGEYGGIGKRETGHMWDENSWGYTMVNSSEELAGLYDSYSQMLSTFKTEKGLCAAVYTQITDVEIEINGLISYDREVIKVDPALIHVSNSLYPRVSEVILPTSEENAQTWRYTTSEPDSNWYSTSYNDNGWSEGAGGFGTDGTPGAVIGTVWDSSDIWMRRTFNPGELTQEDLDDLSWRLHHDEDVQIYLNGVPVLSVGGYTSAYISLTVNDETKSAIVSNAENVIAVHCHQTGGGQFIDVGMSVVSVLGPDSKCGKWGYSDSDLNRDCQVDLLDLAIFTADWMNCSIPDRLDCLNYLVP